MQDIEEKLKEQGYSLQIKDEGVKEYCCICNPLLISTGYEKLAYDFIDKDHEQGVYGFFIFGDKDKIIYASCVVDLSCGAVCSKIANKVGKEGDFKEIFKNYAEVTLLCSNYKHRVPGLARSLLNFVKLWVKENFNKDYLVLTVANVNENASAVQFYKSLDFEQVDNSSEFIYFNKG